MGLLNILIKSLRKVAVHYSATVPDFEGSYAIESSSIPNTSFAANTILPAYFDNMAGNRESTSLFNFRKTVYNDNYFGTDDPDQPDYNIALKDNYLLKSKVRSRDVEVRFNCREYVMIRISDAGTALFIKAQGDNIWIGKIDDTTKSLLPYDTYYSTNAGSAVLAGLGAGDGTGLFTFGASGFDVYAKYNGVEFFRTKQYLLIDSGYVGVRGGGEVLGGGGNSDSNGDYFVDGVTPVYYAINHFSVTHLPRATGFYSDTDNRIVDVRDMDVLPIETTGSMNASTPYHLIITDTDALTKLKVGQRLIVEIGGEGDTFTTPEGDIRGRRGVGGNWPNLHYANIEALQADHSRADQTGAWLEDTRMVYGYYSADSQWFQKKFTNHVAGKPFEGNYYINYTVGKSLRGTIVSISGTTVVLDTPCANSTTNARVFVDVVDQLNALTARNSGSNALTIYFPAGRYSFSERWFFSNTPYWKVKGAGKNLTTFLSPSGCPSMYMPTTTHCLNMEFSGFEVEGCGRKTGYGFAWWDTGFDGAAQINDGTTTNATTIDFFRGIEIGGANTILDGVRVRDAFTAAFAIFGSDSLVRNWELQHTTGICQYMAWQMVAPGGAQRVRFTDGAFDSVELISALESFGTDDVIFENFTMRNGRMSCNSGNRMIVRNATMTFGANCVPAYITPGEPGISFNHNAYNSGVGGLIQNVHFVYEGFSDPYDNQMIQGITVNQDNRDVMIQTVTFTVPDAIRNDPAMNLRAINSTGTNTTIDGVTARGHNLATDDHARLNAGDYNIAINNGAVINTECDTLIIDDDSDVTVSNNIVHDHFQIYPH